MNKFTSIVLAASLALVVAGCPDEDPPATPDADTQTDTTPDDGGTTGDDGGTTGDDGGTTGDDGGTTGDDGGTTGDDGTVSDDGGTPDDGPEAETDTGGPPPPPALGALIDRAGRPGITAALVGEFSEGTTTDAEDDAAYATTAPEDWVSTWTDEIAANLPVYDALDADCTNQLLAGADGADKYSALASLLANDRLWVNTAASTCTTYLGVELQVADECGGRAPAYDVIDATYGALATGGGPIPDGVDADDGTVDPATFPFLDLPSGVAPPVPALGALIDRAGRPGITAALVGEFTGDDSASDASYATAEAADWQNDWTSEIASNLPVYDALDGVCGNQLLNAGDGGSDAYFALATVLVDDRLYVDTSSNTCNAYLGVELGVGGCGGRTPGYDVIDATYTALAYGNEDPSPGPVPDGIAADDGNVNESVFPFLDAPGVQAPPPPALGALIDRAGRPGITAALIGEFTGDDQGSDAAYATDELADWGTNWTAEIQANLAAYDALDADCTNQFGIGADTTAADKYSFLAGVLADDRLYVDTSISTCGLYLGAELAALGIVIPGVGDQCGGRAPSYDVIDVTYTALATGDLENLVPDGVPADDGAANDTTFPFLDAPGN